MIELKEEVKASYFSALDDLRASWPMAAIVSCDSTDGAYIGAQASIDDELVDGFLIQVTTGERIGVILPSATVTKKVCKLCEGKVFHGNCVFEENV